MTEVAFVDSCFFKHFAAGDGLAIFDQLFPGGALTGGCVFAELSVKHAPALVGRLTIQSTSSADLLNAIADIQLHHRALSTADAELLYLAKTYNGILYTDELPLHNACNAHGVPCRRSLGLLREMAAQGVISPTEASAFLHRVLAINPPRRLPPALVAEILEEWESM